MSHLATRPQPGDTRHKLTLLLSALAGAAFFAATLWQGLDYYRLPLADRPAHPLHTSFRPAGSAGLRLGLLSAALFAGIYLYPLRKRIPFLQKIGKTRRWLDFHVLLGLSAPLLVTLHASMKLHGLIGMAYWIMIAIVTSGIAGRYLYSQIPRSVTAAELSLRELSDQAGTLTAELHAQSLITPGELDHVLALPDRAQVDRMGLASAVFTIARLDLLRPFRVAALRRRTLAPSERITTLWGLLPSRHQDLEAVLASVRAQSWITAKILFLNRAAEIFHLWHVVHRPFSYSFILIVTAHITLALLMGYF